MLGGTDRVGPGGVDDSDATSRSRLDIDIVHTDTCPCYHPQPRCARNQVMRHLRIRADNERVRSRHLLLELVLLTNGGDNLESAC